ncbi:MAG TPA: hypothetical protein VHD38_02515 [Candidatus Paceibacterota bacterium]|nr:hypothetical protein [Candidatus Paceibacterota bacterium]
MRNKLQKISKYRPSVLQGRLDLAAGKGGFSLSIEHPAEQRVFRILCVVLAALLCGYLYFVSASILNIMAQREADSSLAQVQSSIASLEQEYFALDEHVDQSIASSLGLTSVSGTQYVYVPGNAASAGTLASKEI